MDLITVLKTENWSVFVDVVQLIVFVQMILIFMSIGALFFFRLYLIKKQKSSIIRKEHISQQLKSLNLGEMHLTSELIRFYKKYIFDFIECMKEAQDNNPLPNNLRRAIAQSILIPKAKRLSQSRRWINQRLALACYEYAGSNIKSEDILIKLIQSDVLIVFVNVLRIIVRHPTQQTMRALISKLSSSRKLYQDLFLQILPTVEGVNKAKLTVYFVDRLEKEHNVYVRCFCYRIAKKLVPVERLFENIQADMLSKNLDLKISALNYLSCIPNQESIHLIEQATHDIHFEVRAVAVKLLGEAKAIAALPLLESKLRDSEWWVRINAANALVALGLKGINVLRRQKREIDKFAYETSQRVLLTIEVSNESGQNN